MARIMLIVVSILVITVVGVIEGIGNGKGGGKVKKPTLPPSPWCNDRANIKCKYKKSMYCSKACREGPYGKDVFCGKGKLDVMTTSQPEGTCCECNTLTTPFPKCSMAPSCSSANGLTCQEECTTANKQQSGWYCGPDWGEVIQAQFKPCCEC